MGTCEKFRKFNTRIVDNPFMQEFLFWDTCTNLNEDAAEIKLREPIRTGFDQKIAKIKAFLGRLVQANTWASVDTRMRLQYITSLCKCRVENSNRKLCLNVCRPRMIINLNYGEFCAISRENAVKVMS